MANQLSEMSKVCGCVQNVTETCETLVDAHFKETKSINDKIIILCRVCSEIVF